MATFVKTQSGSWKAIIRIKGNPLETKTFRIKRDATDWARTTEDEIVRGIYISRNVSERTTLVQALHRYVKEVSPTKKPSTQKPEIRRAKLLQNYFGKYSLASLKTEKIASYRDMCPC